MRNRDRLRVAMDNIAMEKGKKYLHIITASFFFLLPGFIVFFIFYAYGYEARVRNGLSVPVDRLGYYYAEPGDSDKDIYDEISSIEGVTGCGSISGISYNITPELQFLRERQMGHGIHESDDGIATICMDEGIWDAMNIRLTQGLRPQEYALDDPANERVVLLYLSDNYADLTHVGDIYDAKNAKGVLIYRYIVAGFFDVKSRYLDPGVFTNLVMDKVGSCSLDYGIIEVRDSLSTYGCYFTFEGDGDYDRICSDINGISRKYNTAINTYRIAALVQYAREQADRDTKPLRETAVLLGIIMVLALTVSQVYSIITRAKDYGVWLSSGATGKDMALILFMQNLLKTTISLVIGNILTFAFLHIFFGIGGGEARELMNITYLTRCIPVSVVLWAVTVLLSSVIPMVLMRRTSCINLLKGRVME